MSDENNQLGLTDEDLDPLHQEIFDHDNDPDNPNNWGSINGDMDDDDILMGLSTDEIRAAAAKYYMCERALHETNPSYLLNVHNALHQFNFPIFDSNNLNEVEERERQALAILLAKEFDAIKQLAFEDSNFAGMESVLNCYETLLFNTIFHNMLLNRQVHGAIVALHAAGVVDNIQTLVANLKTANEKSTGENTA